MNIWNKGDYKSRSQKRVDNNLGVISLDKVAKKQVYRSEKLKTLDDYYDCTQYDHLMPWSTKDIDLRKKQPLIKYAFAKNLSSRVTAKLLGESVFPDMSIKDNDVDNEFLKMVIKTAKIRSELIEPFKRIINSGSGFVRFKISAGTYDISFYESKYCYPEFQENGELERLIYKYVYDDPNEKDQQGRPKKKWHKVEFNTESEIIYDNPDYSPYEKGEPYFTEVERVDHGFGFVQGQWFRTAKIKDSPDGYGIIEDILSFIDELNYSISQSSRAISYNQDPQLAFKNVDDDIISSLIRSVTKSWNLGRDGSAEFIESEMKGVQEAKILRDAVKVHISDLARVTLLDPEKMVASAQSGKSMEVLQGALVDLINELRACLESQIKSFVTKIALATVLGSKIGFEVPIQMPAGYVPQSFDIEISWPSIFPLTNEDWQKIVNMAIQAANASIISRKTATNKVKEFFGIVDIEAEHAEIAAQPVLNPFGSF